MIFGSTFLIKQKIVYMSKRIEGILIISNVGIGPTYLVKIVETK